MSTFKSCLFMLLQFTFGFFGWMILSVVLPFLFLSLSPTFAPHISGIFQLVFGLGIILITLITKKLRWMGVGILCVILLFVIGAVLRSGCMPPFLFPFPISLMSAC
jgi:hypothetical protein